MYTLKRYFVLILCFCISTYNISFFAYAIGNEEDVARVELSDETMAQTMGAGNLDATMLDYKVGGTEAQAIIVNRAFVDAQYSLEVIDFSGNVLEVLNEGVLPQGQLTMVTGTPTLTGALNRYVRIRLYVDGLGGYQSMDTSFALSSLDSDTDGISDWNEKKYGLNPYDPADAVLDNDGDTLTNIDEINVYRTDPNNADTDGDGIPDNLELQYKLNPLNAADANLDPDNDYLTNLLEIVQYQTDPYVANPGLAPDSDKDGLTDQIEIALGMDPNDATSKTVGLDSAKDKQLIHVLNRTTFGPTLELVKDMRQKGIAAWYEEQLAPVTLDDGLDPAQVIRDTSYITNAQVEKLGAVRPVHSIKQLQARMGLFWDNHFSTSVTESRWDSELHEEDLFFENAFGNFRTLLGLSAKSDAMLRYLNLRNSTAAGPNENYAREVMELHTLGNTVTDGDYTGLDVAALARILTGWYSNQSAGIPSRYSRYTANGLTSSTLFKFVFLAGRHDTGQKTYLGQVFPAGAGVDEGERALDMLAVHDTTARHICLKLARHFVSDEPAQTTLAECALTFKAAGSADDQIAQVLRNLFNSVEFNDPATQRNKFKDHQEYIFSLARLLQWNAVGTLPANGQIPNGVIGDIIEAMGQRQFAKPEPTGWPEDVAGGWLTADSALHRFREGNKMSLDTNQTKLAAYFKAQGITSSGDVMANLFMLMLGGNYDDRHMTMGYWILHPDNSEFDLNTTSLNVADTRIRTLIARIAQLPEFSAQ